MIGARGLFALIVVLAGAPAATASANVVTDWDEIGVKSVQPHWFAAANQAGSFVSRDGDDASRRVQCD